MMRAFIIVPLLLLLADARPQDAITSRGALAQNSSQNITTRPRLEERAGVRSTRGPLLRESVKMVTNQLINNTAADFTLDTRTPPKIRLQHKIIEKRKQEAAENSHPGVAVPVDVDSFLLETSTQKRSIFYRNEYKQPTTDSGISTWILLSGQSTTPKPTRKQTTMKTTQELSDARTPTTTTTEKSINTIKLKPISTQKSRPPTTVSPATAPTSTTKFDKAQNNKILTKIKASILSSASKNKTTTTQIETTTPQSLLSTTNNASDQEIKASTQVSNAESNELPLEAKIVDLDLPEEKMITTTKRPRRPTQPAKRKKNNNKNRRRKPGPGAPNDKSGNVSNSTKIAHKDKPFGTQIYNYLSREVMPTVGVGLVGLMVTAGLASYFLYPFGGLRRAYDSATDRKDYFYDDYAPGGVAEEEIIGKVIAGMPENSEYANSYRSPLARKEAYRTDMTYKQRNTDYFQYPKDYHTVSVGSPLGYRHDVIAEQQKETGYTVGDREYEKKHFVVGNVPKELEQPVTPVTVPEHGPRSLRMKRQAKQLDEENEVIDYKDKNQANYEGNQESQSSTEQVPETTTDEPELMTDAPKPSQPNFLTFLRDVFELKLRVGLGMLLRTTDNFANYLRSVQERVDHLFRELKSNH